MKQDLYNVYIDKQGYLRKEKKYPKLMYIDMRKPIDVGTHLWAKRFEKAFKLLDKDNEYNIVILFKADDCATNKKSIVIKNSKEIVIIDK